MSGFEETSLPAQRVAQRSMDVETMAGVSERLGPIFDQVRGLLDAAGAHPSGDPLALFVPDGDGAKISAGFPTEAAEVAGAEIVEVPAVDRALCHVHEGTVEELGAAWGRLFAELAARGQTAVPPAREVYRQTPPDHLEAWVVELQQPVAGG